MGTLMSDSGMRWFVLDLNPEPWAIGPVGYARRGGKMSAYVGRNQQLDAYKEAVREALGPGHVLITDSLVELRFYFWRNRADYNTSQARTHRKHEADLTNLQKATEDALQGVLFKNDKDVHDVHSIMVEQGPDVRGRVVIGLRPLSGGMAAAVAELPSHVHRMMDALEETQSPGTQLTIPFEPPEDIF